MKCEGHRAGQLPAPSPRLCGSKQESLVSAGGAGGTLRDEPATPPVLAGGDGASGGPLRTSEAQARPPLTPRSPGRVSDFSPPLTLPPSWVTPPPPGKAWGPRSVVSSLSNLAPSPLLLSMLPVLPC